MILFQDNFLTSTVSSWVPKIGAEKLIGGEAPSRITGPMASPMSTPKGSSSSGLGSGDATKQRSHNTIHYDPIRHL